MSFSQEIKDFTQGLQTGYKLAPDPTDEAYKRAEAQRSIAEANNYTSGPYKDEMASRAAYYRAMAANAANRYATHGEGGAPAVPPDYATDFSVPTEDQFDFNSGNPAPAGDVGSQAGMYAGGGMVIRVPHVGPAHVRPAIVRPPHASFPRAMGMLGAPAPHPQSGMTSPGLPKQPRHAGFAAPGRPPRQQMSGMMGQTPQFAHGGAVPPPHRPSAKHPKKFQDHLAQTAQGGAMPGGMSGGMPNTPTMPGLPGSPPMPGYAEGGQVTPDSNQPDLMEGMSYAQAPDQQPVDQGPSAPPPQGALPVASDAMLTGEQQAPSEMDMAHVATLDGLNALHQQFGLANSDTPIVSPAHDHAAKAYYSGAGAADPEQIQQVQQMVDPQGQLPESVRNMRALAWGYQYFQNQGKPKEAQAYAGQLLQSYRQAFNRFSAIAQAAASHGDVDNATRAALKAYAYVPDGNDIQLTKTQDGRYAFSYHNDKGQVMQQGLLSPDEVLQRVTQMGMHNYDDLVAAAAGNRYYGRNGSLVNPPGGGGDTAGATSGGNPAARVPSTKTRDTTYGGDSSNFENAFKGVKDATPDELSTMSSVAGHIYATNDVSRDEAANAVKSILSVNAKDPTQQNFKVVDPKSGAVEINNQVFNIPKPQFMQLMAMRSAAQQKVNHGDTDVARQQEADKVAAVQAVKKGRIATTAAKLAPHALKDLIIGAGAIKG